MTDTEGRLVVCHDIRQTRAKLIEAQQQLGRCLRQARFALTEDERRTFEEIAKEIEDLEMRLHQLHRDLIASCGLQGVEHEPH